MKAIRAALDAAGRAAPDTCNEDLAQKVAAAWAEVEAVERAAKDVTREGGDWGNPDAPAWDVLRSITKGES